jgi:Homing endonuclease associated repeat
MVTAFGEIGNRALHAAKAAELRAQGLTGAEIGAALHLSRSYVSVLLTDPDRAQEAARKRSYAQPCMDCGSMTSGSEGRKPEPRCLRCAALHANKKVWTPDRLIGKMQEWAGRYGEPPSSTDWTVTVQRRRGNQRGLRRLQESEWPHAGTVVKAFGSWNAGIAAAGYRPRAPNGGSGNERRHPRYGTGKKPTMRRDRKMEAIVLKKTETLLWEEIGRISARSFTSAVERLASEAGTYIVVTSGNVFQVAPVERMTVVANK